jgi:hypothetical protein
LYVVHSCCRESSLDGCDQVFEFERSFVPMLGAEPGEGPVAIVRLLYELRALLGLARRLAILCGRPVPLMVAGFFPPR